VRRAATGRARADTGGVSSVPSNGARSADTSSITVCRPVTREAGADVEVCRRVRDGSVPGAGTSSTRPSLTPFIFTAVNLCFRQRRQLAAQDERPGDFSSFSAESRSSGCSWDPARVTVSTILPKLPAPSVDPLRLGFQTVAH